MIDIEQLAKDLTIDIADIFVKEASPRQLEDVKKIIAKELHKVNSHKEA